MPSLAALASPLRALLASAIALVARGEVVIGGLEVEQLLEFGASDGEAEFRFGSSLFTSANGSRVVVGAPGTNRVYVHSFDRATAAEQSIITLSGSGLFGSSVSMDEARGLLAVGAPETGDRGTRSGSLYIFDVMTGQQLHKFTAWDGNSYHYFGQSLAMSADGNRIAVGAYGHTHSTGSVYLFELSGGLITLRQLFASDKSYYDYFGRSVSLSRDGELVAVGAPGNGRGVVYFFDGTNGQELSDGRLPCPSDAVYQTSGDFGKSLAMGQDKSLVAVSANGVAYLFDTATKLQLLRFIPLLDGEHGDGFGSSVSLSLDGSRVAVGALYDDGSRGSVYVFDTVMGTRSKVTANSRASGDQFGYSLSLSEDGSQLAVGSPYNDDKGSNAGSLHLFGIRSLWTLTTTTVTPLRCSPGFFLGGGACSPCAEGTYADADSRACLPLVTHVLSTVQTPELSIANHGLGIVRMAVAVSELPAELAMGSILRYAVDMSASEEESAPRASECSAPWTVSPPQLIAVFSYDDLAGPCGFSVAVSEDSIELRGVLHIHLMHTSSDNTSTVAAQWQKPLFLSFPRSVVGASDFVYTSQSTLMGGNGDINVTQFGSVLVLYATPRYEVTLNPLQTTFQERDSAFLQHELQPKVGGLILLPEMAWLSGSTDSATPAIQNLTISLLGNASDEARFSVTVTACRRCFLHVASKVIAEGGGGRRLAAVHALGNMFMDVAPAEVVEAIETTASTTRTTMSTTTTARTTTSTTVTTSTTPTIALTTSTITTSTRTTTTRAVTSTTRTTSTSSTTTTTPETSYVLQGEMTVRFDDPVRAANDPGVQKSFERVISVTGGLCTNAQIQANSCDNLDMVTATLTPLSSARRLGSNDRRLTAGNLLVDFVIEIPPGAPQDVNPDNVLQSVQLTPADTLATEITAAIQEESTQTYAAVEVTSTPTVQLSVITHTTTTTTTTISTTTISTTTTPLPVRQVETSTTTTSTTARITKKRAAGRALRPSMALALLAAFGVHLLRILA